MTIQHVEVANRRINTPQFFPDRKTAAIGTGAWPRGLRRSDAARYIGVGFTKFDQMVADGRMPKPKMADDCVIWDRTALDDAFDNLPDQSVKHDRGRWKPSV